MKVKLDKNMEEFLGEFELSDREVAIYLTLLKTGPNTIMNLARETGIKRSTTHNNVEELIKKGLVSQTNYGERRMVVAESPDKLQFLLDQKKFKVQKLEKNLPAVIEQINNLVPTEHQQTKTQVKYYEGVDGFIEVCQRSVDNSTGEVLFLGNVEEWRKIYTEEYGKEYYIPARRKKELFLKQLAVWNEEAQKFKDEDSDLLRETRFLPKGLDFSPTIIISDDEVSIMLSTEPYTSIVIEEKIVAQMFKVLYGLLWSEAQ